MLELRYYSYHKTFCHTVFFFSLLRIAKQANIFITINKSVFFVVVAFLNDPMSTKMGKGNTCNACFRYSKSQPWVFFTLDYHYTWSRSKNTIDEIEVSVSMQFTQSLRMLGSIICSE